MGSPRGTSACRGTGMCCEEPLTEPRACHSPTGREGWLVASGAGQVARGTQHTATVARHQHPQLLLCCLMALFICLLCRREMGEYNLLPRFNRFINSL